MQGFLHAIELKTDAIEMDVVISKDHQVVVSHEHFMHHKKCLWPNLKSISKEDEAKLLLFQMDYNEKHGITPQTIKRENIDVFENALGRRLKNEEENAGPKVYSAAEDGGEYFTTSMMEERVKDLRKLMEAASKELNFVEAARLRDELFHFQALLKEKKTGIL